MKQEGEVREIGKERRGGEGGNGETGKRERKRREVRKGLRDNSMLCLSSVNCLYVYVSYARFLAQGQI